MKSRGVGLIVLLVVAAIAWKMWPSDSPTVAAPAIQIAPAKREALPPASVLAVRPETTTAGSTPYARPASTSLRRPVSDNLAQFRARKNYAELHARLRGQPDTPESLYLKAAIYARCATGRMYAEPLAPEARAAKRDQFVTSISQGAKDQTPRIAAYDRMVADPCEGLDLGGFDANQLQRMLNAASDAGDVHAQAWLLADEIEHRMPAEIGKPTQGDTMSVDMFDRLRHLLASADADTIMYLRGALASTLDRGEIRLDGDSFDPMAMHTALTLLACDAGADCGPDSPLLLQACAMRGRCGASNLYDYQYFYGQSPNDSQLVDSYRQSIGRMIMSGDFSELTLSSVDPPGGSTFQFGDPRP